MVEPTDITKPWNLDQVILAPGSASLLIQHYRRREQDLLEANNRYLERARDAEARVNAAMQAIWPCRNDGGFDREIGPIGCSMGDSCVWAGVYPILVGDCAPTPPPSTHLDGVQALLNGLDRTAIAKIVDPSAWLNEGGYEIEQEHSGTSLHVADQIVTYVLRQHRALAITEGSTDA